MSCSRARPVSASAMRPMTWAAASECKSHGRRSGSEAAAVALGVRRGDSSLPARRRGGATRRARRLGETAAHAARAAIRRPAAGYDHPALARSGRRRGLLYLSADHRRPHAADRVGLRRIRRKFDRLDQLRRAGAAYILARRAALAAARAAASAVAPPFPRKERGSYFQANSFGRTFRARASSTALIIPASSLAKKAAAMSTYSLIATRAGTSDLALSS